MLQSTNPPTFKIVDTDIGAKLPTTQASLDLQAAIDQATKIKTTSPALNPIFQLNRAVPDVSALPPMPTHTPVAHDWMTNLLTMVNHLVPNFHAWFAGLAPFLGGLGPLLLGLFATQVLHGLFSGHRQPEHQRAAAEYAYFAVQTETARGFANYLRQNKVGVYDETANGHEIVFAVARYHLGALKRLAAAYGVQIRGV